MIEKLILGTAGLGGLPYGRNKRVVERVDAVELIRHAVARGIKTLDTSPSYGNAEEIIGQAQRYLAGEQLKVITKNSGNKDDAARSLERLSGCDVQFFWHNYDGEVQANSFNVRGLLPPWVIGATVYGKSGLDSCVGVFRHIQVNWNIFDQRTTETVPWLGAGEKIYVRSVFLQGVLSGGEPPDERLRPLIERAQQFARAYGVDLKTLALRAALDNELIHRVVVGPTDLLELCEIVGIAMSKPLGISSRFLAMLDAENAELTDPRKWVA